MPEPPPVIRATRPLRGGETATSNFADSGDQYSISNMSLADIEENKPIKLYDGSTSIDLAKRNLNASVQNISTTFNALQRENWK